MTVPTAAGFRAGLLDDAQRAVGIGRAFHVHAHEISEFLRAARDDAQLLGAKFPAEIEAEMRQLERDIRLDARRRDLLQRFRVGRARAFRILARDHVFAEVIQAHRHSGFVAGSRRFDGGGEFLAGDEPARHAARGAMGSNPAAKPGAFCQFEQQRA